MRNMEEIDRGIIMRCMKKALSKVIGNPPKLIDLMSETVVSLSEEGFPVQVMEGNSLATFDNACEQEHLQVLLMEGHGQLLALGYIVPRVKPASDPPNHRWFRITEAGRRWVESSDPVPEDPQGYLAYLTEQVPQLDPIVRQYVGEAVLTYERRVIFASAVMIGAASEKLIYMLADALLSSIRDHNRKTDLQQAKDNRSLYKMLNLISENVERAKPKKPGGRARPVHEGAESHLFSLQERIRAQRNDAVHPNTAEVTPEGVRLSLSAFPGACKKVYDLMDWLGKNPI